MNYFQNSFDTGLYSPVLIFFGIFSLKTFLAFNKTCRMNNFLIKSQSVFFVATNEKRRCRTGDCIISLNRIKVLSLINLMFAFFTYCTHTYVFTLYTTCLMCEKSIQLIDHEFRLSRNLEGDFSLP